MKKLYLLIILLSSLSTVNGSNLFEDKPIYEYKNYLKELGEVTNTNNEKHILDKADVDEAFKMSSESIQYGVSWFLIDGFLKFQKNGEVINLAKHYSKELESGASIEQLGFKKGNWDTTKLIFQTVLDNFCWQDGKTTEVTLEEVAANMILRKRISDFITINDQ